MNKIYLETKCPICGKNIFLNSHGYQCEGCTFHVSSFICNRYMTPHEIEKLLNGKKIILDGFSSNSGKVFSSIPIIEGNEVKLDNTVVNDPILGRIIVGPQSFVCAIEGDHQRSKLKIRRSYNGHRITIEDVKTLLKEGYVVLDTFDEEGNPQRQRLSFDKRTHKVAFHQ